MNWLDDAHEKLRIGGFSVEKKASVDKYAAILNAA